MDIEPEVGWLLGGYALGIFVMSIIGGYLPNLVRMTHTRTQLLMAFVAGIILGVAVYHMLPHAVTAIGGAEALESAVSWLMAGVVLTLLMLYFFDFHEHDFSHEHAHQHDTSDATRTHLRPFSWAGIVIGLGVHALTEGMAISSTIRITEHSYSGLAGFGVFLAIMLHKPLDSLSIVSIMAEKGQSVYRQRLANFCFALVCPIAIFVAYWAPSQLEESQSYAIGSALAFAAGTFLSISLSDLIPEIHFHKHDRLRIASSFLVGIAVAYALHWLEPGSLHVHD